MAFEKVMMIMVVFAVMLVSTQAQDTSCIQALMPCAQFINSTTNPPPMCCGPLKEALKTQVPCLCSLFENPALAGSGASNINVTQAMEFPIKCGLKAFDSNVCKKGQGAAPAKSPVAGGKATTSSESTPGPAGKSGANSVTWTGPISSLMLLVAGLMFY